MRRATSTENGGCDPAMARSSIASAFVVVDGKASDKETVFAIPSREEGGASMHRTVIVDQQYMARLKIVRQFFLVVYANNFFHQHICCGGES